MRKRTGEEPSRKTMIIQVKVRVPIHITVSELREWVKHDLGSWKGYYSGVYDYPDYRCISVKRIDG